MEQWQAAWNAPELAAKRARQQANRLANPSLHTGGSIGFGEHQRRMEEQLGRTVLPHELMLHTHARAPERTEPVDQRSQEIVDRTREILTQRSTQQSEESLSFQDSCEAYYEAVGGVGPGGAVFGVGGAAPEYFSQQISSSRREAARPAQLQRRNDEMTERMEEMQKRLADMEAAQREYQQRMDLFMAEMRANQGGASSSSRPPPSPPAPDA